MSMQRSSTGLGRTLDDADEIGYRLKSGKMINNATVMSSAEDYARTLGYMTGPEIEEFVKEISVRVLTLILVLR